MTDRLVTVTAICAFELGHRQIRRGQDIHIPATQAIILARERKITVTRNAHIEPDQEPTEPPRRRRYRRRDLQAES